MTEPTDQKPSGWNFLLSKDGLDFLLTRIGLPAVVLAALLWFHFHSFESFRKEVEWKQERIIRNTRAIMQKLGIPVIFDGDRKDE